MPLKKQVRNLKCIFLWLRMIQTELSNEVVLVIKNRRPILLWMLLLLQFTIVGNAQ